jgi:hypothetical protein
MGNQNQESQKATETKTETATAAIAPLKALTLEEQERIRLDLEVARQRDEEATKAATERRKAEQKAAERGWKRKNLLVNWAQRLADGMLFRWNENMMIRYADTNKQLRPGQTHDVLVRIMDGFHGGEKDKGIWKTEAEAEEHNARIWALAQKEAKRDKTVQFGTDFGPKVRVAEGAPPPPDSIAAEMASIPRTF